MINKKIKIKFGVELDPDGVRVLFADGDEKLFDWSELIKQEISFFMLRFENGERKFNRAGFDEFDKIAEGLIDAGAEIKKILAESTIDEPTKLSSYQKAILRLKSLQRSKDHQELLGLGAGCTESWEFDFSDSHRDDDE